jgi:hypothetical protein
MTPLNSLNANELCDYRVNDTTIQDGLYRAASMTPFYIRRLFAYDHARFWERRADLHSTLRRGREALDGEPGTHPETATQILNAIGAELPSAPPA